MPRRNLRLRVNARYSLPLYPHPSLFFHLLPLLPSCSRIDGDMQVLYDYNADSDSELTIKEGDLLTIETEDEGWFFGSNSKGETGRYDEGGEEGKGMRRGRE